MAPGYFKEIAHPMDLSTIRSKIGSEYNSFADFDDDVKLMLDNCVKYNGTGSDFTRVKKIE